MTWKDKYKENKKLIQGYSDYMLTEKLKPEDYLKLINEIARLDAQNKEIEQMPFIKIDNEINNYTIEI